MLLALALLAHAQDTVDPALLHAEVIAYDRTETDVYAFAIPRCDKVRAIFRDERPSDRPRTAKVIVSIQNAGTQLCLYKGVSLQGFLEGEYVTSQRNPEGTGFFIQPGGEVSVRVKLAHPERPRGAVAVAIPPGSGVIILQGLGPGEEPSVPQVPPSR